MKVRADTRPSQAVWLESLRYCPLPLATVGLAVKLAAYASSDGSDIFPGVDRLGITAGITERSVRPHLRALERAGWIEAEGGGAGRGDRRQWRLTWPADFDMSSARKKEDEDVRLLRTTEGGSSVSKKAEERRPTRGKSGDTHLPLPETSSTTSYDRPLMQRVRCPETPERGEEAPSPKGTVELSIVLDDLAAEVVNVSRSAGRPWSRKATRRVLEDELGEGDLDELRGRALAAALDLTGSSPESIRWQAVPQAPRPPSDWEQFRDSDALRSVREHYVDRARAVDPHAPAAVRTATAHKLWCRDGRPREALASSGVAS